MNKAGLIFAVLAAVLWGTYGTFVTFLVGYGFSETAIAVFAPIGLIVFFLIAALINDRRSLILSKKQFICMLAGGIIGVTGTNVLYAAALGTGFSVGMASVITFANYFLVMIASRFIWKIKITPAKIGAGIIALVGIALLLQIWTEMSFSSIGLILMICTACTFAFAYIITPIAFDFGAKPDSFYFWINLIGFIITCCVNPPWSVFSEVSSVYAAAGIIPILLLLGLMLVPQFGSYFFLGRAMQKMEAPIVVIIFALDPIVSSILGFFFLDQTLNFIQILGMVIIIAGLVWLQLTELKEGKKLENPSN